MPQDIVLSSDDLDELLEQARGQITNSNQTVAEAERKVISENIARMGRDRSWISMRVSVLLCMTDLAHASKLKEHDDNDDFQGTTGRAA